MNLLVIINPAATRATRRLRERVLAGIADSPGAHAAVTEAPGEAEGLARQAADAGARAVIVVGGDGTFSEAANGLAGSRTALVCVPAGLTNVFPRLLGLPRDPLAALRRQLGDPNPRQVDLGLVNDRKFLFSSGMGLTAEANSVLAGKGPQVKRHLGPGLFALAAVSAARRLDREGSPNVILHAGGEPLSGVSVVVQNGDAISFAGPRALRVCRDAGLQTETLSFAVLSRATARTAVRVPMRLAASCPERVQGDRDVDGVASVVSAEVTATGGPLAVEADGEHLGLHDRVAYGIAPGALAVLA